MTEQDLRVLVREAIARHLEGGARPAVPAATVVDTVSVRAHMSHAQFVMPAAMDSDGPCLIEPAVPCNHCGFCKSYGH
jgi:hypothetical protein